MSLSAKKSGSYSPVTAVSFKQTGVYTVVAGMFAKVASGYVSILGDALQPPMNLTTPQISGTAIAESTLTATPGSWSPEPTGYVYEWFSGGLTVAGATEQTYTLTASDVGKSVVVKVTASNLGGSSVAFSSETAIVTAPPFPTVGLIYRVDATDRSSTNITQVDNKVSSLSNKSTSGFVAAVQTNDALRPLTNTGTLLGGNALKFKAQDRLQMPSTLNSIAASDCTIYVSYASETPTVQSRMVCWSNGVSPVIHISQTNNRNDLRFGAVTCQITNPSVTTPRVAGLRRVGDSLTGFVDGLRNTITGATTMTVTGNPRIGGEVNAINNFVGTIREILVYNVAHTDQQITDTIAYMSRAETIVLQPPVSVFPPVLWGGNQVGEAYEITDGVWDYAPTSYVKVLKKDGIVQTQPYYKTAGDSGTLTAEVTATNQDGSAMATSNSVQANAAYVPAAMLNGTNRSQVAGLTNQLGSARAGGNVMVRGEFRNKMSTGRYPLKNPRFIFPNWGVLGGDKTVNNSISLDVAFEDGKSTTFTPLTFGGASLGVIAPGANGETDPMAVTIPPYTDYFLRVGVQVPDATGSFYDGIAAITDAGVFSTRLQASSQVAGVGPMTKFGGDSALNFYSYGAIGVVGELPVGAVSIGGFGDSIGAGGFLRLGVENATGGRVPFSDYCRPGEFMQLFVDSASPGYRANMTQYHTHNILQFGANDLTGSFGLATFQARYQAAWAKLKAQGQIVAQTTIFPRQKSLADTSPNGPNFEPGGIRDQLNAWFYTRVGIDIDAVIDCSTPVQLSGDSSKFNPAYTGDGTHLNDAGKIAAAVPVTTWVNSVLAT